jgi:hypothetical protein
MMAGRAGRVQALLLHEELVRPADCQVLMAIPTSREGFERDLSLASKDFVPNLCPIWDMYRLTTVDVFKRERQHWERDGVEVLEDVTIECFRDRLTRATHAVTVLFAHWAREGVEFADQIVSIPAVIDAVPVDFRGWLDLSVCHPTQLADGLRRSRGPECRIKFSHGKAIPSLWMSYYSVLFAYMAKGTYCYLDATELAVTRFFEA